MKALRKKNKLPPNIQIDMRIDKEYIDLDYYHIGDYIHCAKNNKTYQVIKK